MASEVHGAHAEGTGPPPQQEGVAGEAGQVSVVAAGNVVSTPAQPGELRADRALQEGQVHGGARCWGS